MAGAAPATPAATRPLAEWAQQCFEGTGTTSVPSVLLALGQYLGMPHLTAAGFKNLGRKTPGTPLIRSIPTHEAALAEWVELLREVSVEAPTLVPLSTPTVRIYGYQ